MRLAHSVALFAILASPLAAMADSVGITVYNTGESVTAGLDNNYTVIYNDGVVPYSNPSPVSGGTAATAIGSPGYYYAAPAGTQYVSVPTGSGPAGYFTYTTTFSLTGLDPSTATLSGDYDGDNNVAVYLNGTEIAYNLYGGNSYGYGFSGQSTFDATSGFVSGVNTLQFVVENGNDGDDLAGPTALLVSGLSGSADTPEPSSLVLLGTGILGLAGAARRKLRS